MLCFDGLAMFIQRWASGIAQSQKGHGKVRLRERDHVYFLGLENLRIFQKCGQSVLQTWVFLIASWILSWGIEWGRHWIDPLQKRIENFSPSQQNRKAKTKIGDRRGRRRDVCWATKNWQSEELNWRKTGWNLEREERKVTSDQKRHPP